MEPQVGDDCSVVAQWPPLMLILEPLGQVATPKGLELTAGEDVVVAVTRRLSVAAGGVRRGEGLTRLMDISVDVAQIEVGDDGALGFEPAPLNLLGPLAATLQPRARGVLRPGGVEVALEDA